MSLNTDPKDDRIQELETDLQCISDQVEEECAKALESIGVTDVPDGGGQPDYLLPSIVGQTLQILLDKIEEHHSREQRVISEEMASGRLLAERDALKASALNMVANAGDEKDGGSAAQYIIRDALRRCGMINALLGGKV
jgi:hypothetical protein